jgi:hypothetical protein
LADVLDQLGTAAEVLDQLGTAAEVLDQLGTAAEVLDQLGAVSYWSSSVSHELFTTNGVDNGQNK